MQPSIYNTTTNQPNHPIIRHDPANFTVGPQGLGGGGSTAEYDVMTAAYKERFSQASNLLGHNSTTTLVQLAAMSDSLDFIHDVISQHVISLKSGGGDDGGDKKEGGWEDLELLARRY